jgi:hypothetical protein
MKNSLLSVNRKKTEIVIISICLAISILFTIYTIIHYNKNWSELYIQWRLEFIMTLFLYANTVLFRLLAYSIMLLFRKNRP